MTTIISFEGLDGTGKSTLARWLYDRLSANYKVKLIKESESSVVRALPKDADSLTILFAFMSARRHNIKLAQQETFDFLIYDRYIDSTIAYHHYGASVPLFWIVWCHRVIRARFADRTFYLDGDLKQIYARMTAEDKQHSLEFYRKVQAGFQQTIKEDPNRFCCLSAFASLECNQQAIVKRLESLKK